MSEISELLPCPHCGCTDIFINDNGDEEWVECKWCGATSGYDPAPEFEDKPVSWHWNRRAEAQQEPLPIGAVTEAMLRDLEEISSAVFGDLGSDPDVYADYDRLSALSGKMQRAIAALEAAFAARPAAEPVAVKGLAEGAIPAWPPLKKALWDVVTGETLNDGHYINAYDLTNKLYSAAALVSTPAPGLVEALRRIKDATPENTNSATAAEMASWTYAVAASALASITETGGTKE